MWAREAGRLRVVGAAVGGRLRGRGGGHGGLHGARAAGGRRLRRAHCVSTVLRQNRYHCHCASAHLHVLVLTLTT